MAGITNREQIGYFDTHLWPLTDEQLDAQEQDEDREPADCENGPSPLDVPERQRADGHAHARAFLSSLALDGTLSHDQVRVLFEEAELEEGHYDPYGELPERESAWARNEWVEKVWLVWEQDEVQGYGGPEEGGWWYHLGWPTWRIVPTVFRTEDEAYEVCRHLNAFMTSNRYGEGLAWTVSSSFPFEPSGRPRYC